jgi:hypothetical protein
MRGFQEEWNDQWYQMQQKDQEDRGKKLAAGYWLG